MGRAVSTSNIVAQSDRAKQAKRLAKKRDDPFFRSNLQSMRQMLSGGQTLYDIRDKLGVKKDHDWHDLVTVMAQSFANPENILLEWSVRQNSRYALAADMLSRAKAAKDFDSEAKAIMMMVKIDENFLELQKTLGLIKPVTDPNSLGYGISSEDIDLAERRFAGIIEQRISNKLAVERETQPAQSIELLSRTEPGGETDRLDEASLAQNTTHGSIEGHQNQEGITSRGFDLLSNPIILDVENKRMP